MDLAENQVEVAARALALMCPDMPCTSRNCTLPQAVHSACMAAECSVRWVAEAFGVVSVSAAAHMSCAGACGCLRAASRPRLRCLLAVNPSVPPRHMGSRALTPPSPRRAARRVGSAHCQPWAGRRHPLTLIGQRPERGLHPRPSRSPDLQAQVEEPVCFTVTGKVPPFDGMKGCRACAASSSCKT